jgi:hypothetical protein
MGHIRLWNLIMRPALFALCLLASPLTAQADVAPVQIGPWTVEKIFDTCAAYNRPNSELQESPIHVLGFQLPKDAGMSLITAFWPGALGADENGLQITLGDVVFKVGAKPFLNDSDSLRTGDLPDQVLAAMAGPVEVGTLITLRAEPSQAEVSFEAGDLPAVMVALEACVTG